MAPRSIFKFISSVAFINGMKSQSSSAKPWIELFVEECFYDAGTALSLVLLDGPFYMLVI